MKIKTSELVGSALDWAVASWADAITQANNTRAKASKLGEEVDVPEELINDLNRSKEN